MRGSYSGCFRRNLKAWISLVILTQCMLVLVYLDVTKSVNTPGFLSLVRRSVFGGTDLVGPASRPQPVHHAISTGIEDHLVERHGLHWITDERKSNGTRESEPDDVNNVRVKSNQRDSFQKHGVVSNRDDVRNIPHGNNRAGQQVIKHIFTTTSSDYETTTLFPRVIPKSKLNLSHRSSAKGNSKKYRKHSGESVLPKGDNLEPKDVIGHHLNSNKVKHSGNVILERKERIPKTNENIWDTNSQKKMQHESSRLSHNAVSKDNPQQADSVVANLPWKYRSTHQAAETELSDMLQKSQFRDHKKSNTYSRENPLPDIEILQNKPESIHNKPPSYKSVDTPIGVQGKLEKKSTINGNQKVRVYADNTRALNRAIYNATSRLVRTSHRDTRIKITDSATFGNAKENVNFQTAENLNLNPKVQYDIQRQPMYQNQFKQQNVHEHIIPRQELPRQNIHQSEVKPNAAVPQLGVQQVQVQVGHRPRDDNRNRIETAVKSVNGTDYRIRVNHPQDSNKQGAIVLPQRRVQGVATRKQNFSKEAKQDKHFSPPIKISNNLYNITIRNQVRKDGFQAVTAPKRTPILDHPNRVVDFLKPTVFQLPNPQSTRDYFLTVGNSGCYEEGTVSVDKDKGVANSTSINSYCQCKQEWHGPNCSLPDIFYFSTASGFMHSVKPRSSFRRIINALAFNVEFELLEARFYELSDVVDVFIIFESNFSNFGEPKPLRLLQKLQKGYLKEFHHKIVYIMRDYFPRGGKENGWLVDEHMRTFIGREGLSRLANTKPDDLFIYTDADEFPSRDALQFLRLHDGYPEPFGLSLRWSVFGFFWKQYEPTRIYVGCTLSMMRYVFQYSAFELRAGDYFTKHSALIQAYVTSGGNVYEWHLGENGFPAGWHCSWCMPPEGIKIKLQSAINADFPRWGDYPNKLRLDYIRQLIRNGVWFDDEMKFDSLVSPATDSFYAPNYMLANFDRYKMLLHLPDV